MGEEEGSGGGVGWGSPLRAARVSPTACTHTRTHALGSAETATEGGGNGRVQLVPAARSGGCWVDPVRAQTGRPAPLGPGRHPPARCWGPRDAAASTSRR